MESSVEEISAFDTKGTIRKRTPLSPKAFMGSGDWGYDENEYGRNLFYTQDDMRDIVAYAKEKTYRGRTRDRYARTYGRGNIVLSQFVVYARTSRRQHSMGCLG